MIFMLVLGLAACASVNVSKPEQKAKNKAELNRLLNINDLNERAFAYHQYCLKKSEPLSEQFLKNFEITANLLYDELIYTYNWQPKYTVEQIVKRREYIQQTLSNHYLTKGCQSEEASMGLAHYRDYSSVKE